MFSSTRRISTHRSRFSTQIPQKPTRHLSNSSLNYYVQNHPFLTLFAFTSAVTGISAVFSVPYKNEKIEQLSTALIAKNQQSAALESKNLTLEKELEEMTKERKDTYNSFQKFYRCTQKTNNTVPCEEFLSDKIKRSQNTRG